MARILKLRGDPEAAEENSKEIEAYVTGVVWDSLCPPTPFEVGKNYLVRTITMINVGKCVSTKGNFLILTNASWIGDTGRFHECLQRNDVFKEVEPFKHDVFINLQSIVDATPWPYTLPTETK